MGIGLAVVDAVRLAKRRVNAHVADPGRRWLTSGLVRMYGEEINATVLHVLEGTPPRGFVLEQRDLNGQVSFAVALDSNGSVLEKFHALVVQDGPEDDDDDDDDDDEEDDDEEGYCAVCKGPCQGH